MPEERKGPGRGAAPFLVSVQGLKDSGKTVVCRAVLAELAARGYRVAAVKSSHLETLDLQPRGADTARLAEAGAEKVVGLARSQTITVWQRRASPREGLELLGGEAQLIVAEGACRLPGAESAPVVLCLTAVGRLEETLRVRRLSPARVLALSGTFAAVSDRAPEPSRPAPGPARGAQTPGRQAEPGALGGGKPVIDARAPEGRRELVRLILERAGNPAPSGRPRGPLVEDPAWDPAGG